MSSINGFNWKSESLIRRMNMLSLNRGRDDSGYYVDQIISLGIRRLAIYDNPYLDVKQPFIYKRQKKQYVVLIDGEINNKFDLIEELEEQGYDIESDSDVELIAFLYDRHGKKFVEQLDGSFALAIYDVLKKKLLLYRSFMGGKPLYYYTKGNKFAFSSSFNALFSLKTIPKTKQTIDAQAVELFFNLGYVPSPYTLHKNIRKLEHGALLEYDLSKNTYSIEKHIFIDTSKRRLKKDKDVLNEIDKALSLSMDEAISTYDEGIYLGGGIDSTSLLYKLKDFIPYDEILSFSVVLKEDKTYAKNISKIAKYFGIKHHQYFLTYDDAINYFKKYYGVFEEPNIDITSIFLMRLNEKAKRYIDVAIDGEGGEEIFGGKFIYKAYLMHLYLSKLPRFVKGIAYYVLSALSPKPFSELWYFKELLALGSKKSSFIYGFLKHHKYVSKLGKDYAKSAYKHAESLAKDDIDIIFLYELLYRLPDGKLLMEDVVANVNGIELRHPFLSRYFLNLFMRIPPKKRVSLLDSKKAYKRYVERFLPKDFIKQDEYDYKYNFEYDKVALHFLPKAKTYATRLKNRNLISEDLYNFYSSKVFSKKSVFWEMYVLMLYLYWAWLKHYGYV